MRFSRVFVTAIAVALLTPVFSAHAAVLNFQLTNGADDRTDLLSDNGYGLRLDLFGAAAPLPPGVKNSEHWLFDFESALSDMRATLDTDTGEFRISGQSFGGQKEGNGYTAGSTGIFDIEFVYSVGATVTQNGDSLVYEILTASPDNNGSVTPTFTSTEGGLFPQLVAGNSIAIEQFMQFFFNNDRGPFEGEGWLNYTALNGAHIAGVDWIFSAVETAIPVPAALWLFGSGLGLLGWLRRRSV